MQYIIILQKFRIKIMLAGYNTNISYKDVTYHIQTEDSGKGNPVIVTLLYAQGAILASKKTNYAHHLQDPDLHEKLKKIMKIQHKSMIKDLIAGKFTGDLTIETGTETEVQFNLDVDNRAQLKEENVLNQKEPITEKPQLKRSLDDILLNYIMKRKK
jgi:hypothetical protein